MKCHLCPTFVFVMTVPEDDITLSGEETQLVVLPTAAAVFDVGRLVQSPIPNTFGYRLCCRVSLSTSTQPAASATGLVLRTSGGLIGGVTWSISYYEKGEHPNVSFFCYFYSPTSSRPNSLIHTLYYGCTEHCKCSLLIHTHSEILHAPVQMWW